MNKKLMQLGVFVATMATLSTPVLANEVVDSEKSNDVSKTELEATPKETESTTTKKRIIFEPRLDADGNLILGPNPNEPKIEEPDNTEEEGLENDFRKRVENVDMPIYRSVLHLILEYGDYKGEQEGLKDEHCTGTVIGKNTLITAAHCVAGENRGVVTGGKAILPSKDGNKEFEIEKVIYHPNWKNEKLERYRRFDYDVALVKIRPTAEGKRIDEILGTVPINSKVESRVGKMVTNPGYPIDKLEKHGITQWDSIGGKIISENEYNYRTNFFTYGGQSGSVLLDDNKEIIGILSSGSIDTAMFIKMQPELYKWISQHVDFETASKSEQDNVKKPEISPKADEKEDKKTENNVKDPEKSSMSDNKIVDQVSSKDEKGKQTGVVVEKKLPETGTADGAIFSLLGTLLAGLGVAYRKIKM